MTRFREEVRIIPPVAWGIAILLYAGFVTFLAGFVWQQKPEPYSWPFWVKTLFTALVPVPTAIYVLLIGYVYRDAKRRAMRHVLWTWLAALIPNGIGIVLYFVVRDPMVVPCPGCAAPTRPGFAFCPKCGKTLAPACPQCRRALEPDWSLCAYCGTRLSS